MLSRKKTSSVSNRCIPFIDSHRVPEVLRRNFPSPSNHKKCLPQGTTARNLYCDQVRRAAKERELMEALLPDGDEEPADETASAAVGLSDLESLMGTLTPADRMLFELRYTEGYNASELGEMLKLPPGTVRTRLLKIRTKLKDELLEE